MTTYNALLNETVYDLAIKLYKDGRGVNDIILLNPSLDLNSTTTAGQAIVYDETKVYKKESFTFSTPAPGRPTYKARAGQSIFDVALQLYGDINRLADVIGQVTSINGSVYPGTPFSTLPTRNALANGLFLRTLVATVPLDSGALSYILREDGSYLLREDGSRFIREN